MLKIITTPQEALKISHYSDRFYVLASKQDEILQALPSWEWFHDSKNVRGEKISCIGLPIEAW